MDTWVCFWGKYKKFHRGRKGSTEVLDLTECGRCESRTGSLCLSVSHTEEKWERQEDPTPLWNHFSAYTFFNPGPWPCHLSFMQQDTPIEDYSPLKSNLPFLRTIEVGSSEKIISLKFLQMMKIIARVLSFYSTSKESVLSVLQTLRGWRKKLKHEDAWKPGRRQQRFSVSTMRSRRTPVVGLRI